MSGRQQDAAAGAQTRVLKSADMERVLVFLSSCAHGPRALQHELRLAASALTALRLCPSSSSPVQGPPPARPRWSTCTATRCRWSGWSTGTTPSATPPTSSSPRRRPAEPTGERSPAPGQPNAPAHAPAPPHDSQRLPRAPRPRLPSGTSIGHRTATNLLPPLLRVSTSRPSPSTSPSGETRACRPTDTGPSTRGECFVVPVRPAAPLPPVALAQQQQAAPCLVAQNAWLRRRQRLQCADSAVTTDANYASHVRLV